MNYPPVKGLAGPMVDHSTQRVYYVDLRTQQPIAGDVVVQRLIAQGQMQPPVQQYGQQPYGAPVSPYGPQYAPQQGMVGGYAPPPMPQYPQQPAYGQPASALGMNIPMAPPPVNLAADTVQRAMDPAPQHVAAPVYHDWYISLLKPPRSSVAYPVDIYAPIALEVSGITKTILFKRDYLGEVMNKNEHLQITPDVAIEPDVAIAKIAAEPPISTSDRRFVSYIESEYAVENISALAVLAQNGQDGDAIPVVTGQLTQPVSVIDSPACEIIQHLTEKGWDKDYLNMASGYRDKVMKKYPRLATIIEERATEIVNDILAHVLRVNVRITDSIFLDYTDLMRYLYKNGYADDFTRIFEKMLEERLVISVGSLNTNGDREDDTVRVDVATLCENITMIYIPEAIPKMTSGVVIQDTLRKYIDSAVIQLERKYKSLSTIYVCSKAQQIYRVAWSLTKMTSCRLYSIC